MKAQLDALVLEMYRGGILYSEAVREFKKTFITTVLRENGGNQMKSARELGMHRNTLNRIISALELDIQAIRMLAQRRPPKAARPFPSGKKERLL